MATIRDVAREAGVSKATVSHVINGTKFVSAELAARVHAAVDRLGYEPSLIASSLKTKTTKTVGVVLQDMLHHAVNPFLKGISHVLAPTDTTISLAEASGQWGRETQHIKDLIAKRVDGIIIQPCMSDRVEIGRALELSIPVVVASAIDEPAGVSVVAADFTVGVARAVGHLVELGHRRIAFVAGSLPTSERQAVFAAFSEALARRGIAYDSSLILTNSASKTGGYKCMTRLARVHARPTAVFCADLDMAIGCLKAMQEQGLRCPEQVSLISVGAHPWLDVVDPPLSSVQASHYDAGRLAAEEIVRRLRDPSVDAKRVAIPTQFLPRASTAPARS